MLLMNLLKDLSDFPSWFSKKLETAIEDKINPYQKFELSDKESEYIKFK